MTKMSLYVKGLFVNAPCRDWAFLFGAAPLDEDRIEAFTMIGDADSGQAAFTGAAMLTLSLVALSALMRLLTWSAMSAAVPAGERSC
jgi:hypothetical protein